MIPTPVILALSGAWAVWLLIDLVVLAPAFGSTDLHIFKDAGINWALGEGYVSRYTFAAYPPVYPFLFGLYTKLAGVSVEANQLFNSLIGFGAGLIGWYAIARLVLRVWPGAGGQIAAVLVGMAAVPLAFFAVIDDRPNALGFVFGAAAILLAVPSPGGERTRARAAGAGFLAALALFTSPFVGGWAGAALLALFADAVRGADRAMARFLAGFVPAALTAAVLAVLVLAVMELAAPGWFLRFMGVVTGGGTENRSGIAYFLALLSGDTDVWIRGYMFSNFEHGALFAKMILVTLCLAGAMAAARLTAGSGRRGGLGRLWPFLVLTPLPALIAPYQTTYWGVSAALAIVAWSAMAMTMDARPRRISAIALLLAYAGVAAATVPSLAHGVLSRATTGASLERARAFLAANRPVLTGTEGYLAVDPALYMLFREQGYRPLMTGPDVFETPETRARLSWVALSYAGSGKPYRPLMPGWLSEDEFDVVWQPSLPQLVTLFGKPLSASSHSWEPAILRRRGCESCPARLRDG